MAKTDALKSNTEKLIATLLTPEKTKHVSAGTFFTPPDRSHREHPPLDEKDY